MTALKKLRHSMSKIRPLQAQPLIKSPSSQNISEPTKVSFQPTSKHFQAKHHVTTSTAPKNVSTAKACSPEKEKAWRIKWEFYIESRCPSYSLHKVHNLLRYKCWATQSHKACKTQSCKISKLESGYPFPSVTRSKLAGFYMNKPDCLQYSIVRLASTPCRDQVGVGLHHSQSRYIYVPRHLPRVPELQSFGYPFTATSCMIAIARTVAPHVNVVSMLGEVHGAQQASIQMPYGRTLTNNYSMPFNFDEGRRA